MQALSQMMDNPTFYQTCSFLYLTVENELINDERIYANQYQNPTAVAASEIIKAPLRIAR
jgi:hypothetical protein